MKTKAKHISEKKDVLSIKLNFVKENKWFMLALIIFLLSILFLQLSLTPTYSQEKASYALEMYTSNQTEIDAYLDSIDAELILEKEDILDDYFLASIRGDFIWLKEKEQQLFNSKPSSDLYAKEAAFSVFLLKMIELNEAFSMEFGDPEFEFTIEQAKTEQINIPFLLSPEKIVELFDGDVKQANIFSNTLNYLFNDYITLKKKMILEENVIESKYVEAKKLLLVPELSEYEE
jgi:hypothetical protein